MAVIRIPTTLRSYTGNRAELEVPGDTVGEVLEALELRCAGIGARLLDEKGSVRRYVNIFHGDEDIRFLEGLGTKLTPDSTLSIIPAMAGG